jgi:SAM-dependent methyltransferase
MSEALRLESVERVVTKPQTSATIMARTQRKSLSHIMAFARAKIAVGKALRTIDEKQFNQFRERYKDAEVAGGGYSKYLDLRKWFSAKLTYVYMLGLDRGRPLKILDLGTGPGYFPYLCALQGHSVEAVDLDIVPMYNDLCRFLKVKRTTWRINPFEALPNLGSKFDLVTAFMIKFNQHDLPGQWGAKEWQFLLDDLQKNQLKANGRIFLDFNTCSDGTWFDDSLIKFFVSRSARIYRCHVDINGPAPNGAVHLLDRLFAGSVMFP